MNQPNTASRGPARLGVDIGGTFTDIALETGDRRLTAKLLTTHAAPDDAVIEGIGRVVAEAGLVPDDIGVIVHGTTLATNALIERKGARTALVTTEGFRDVIEMGTESRFEQYDLDMVKPDPLIPRHLRFGVPERLSVSGDVLKPLDEAAVEALAVEIEQAGIESVAVGFLHSYRHPRHEERTAEILRARLPDLWISLSSDVSPEIREYDRFSTTCANAYVKPLVARYLGRLEQRLAEGGYRCPLFLMLSSGGVTEVGTAIRYPVRLIESGPAGGAILAADIAARAGLDQVLSFDMGGTTAKICLIDDAAPLRSRVFEVARVYRFKPGSGLPLRIPVIEMVEIGAGGGSIARVDRLNRITVGPDSAGSEPGPACYGRGGTLPTVTDANVVLGRIDPAGFAGGTMPLDAEAAKGALDRSLGAPLGHPVEAAAFGVVEIVDENMANAAREHAVERGTALDGRTMIAFGGSAPVHAARLAEKLGVDRVLVPVSAGVGSAVGFLRAPVAYEVVRTSHQRLAGFDPAPVNAAFDEMSAEAHAVVGKGAPGAARHERRTAFMRYVGQGHEIAVDVPVRPLTAADAGLLRDAYQAAYRAKYGRVIDRVDVEAVNWTLSVAADRPEPAPEAVPSAVTAAAPAGRRPVIDASGRFGDVPVYRRGDLPPGSSLEGPAILVEDETTTVVTAAFDAAITGDGHILLTRKAEAPR